MSDLLAYNIPNTVHVNVRNTNSEQILTEIDNILNNKHIDYQSDNISNKHKTNHQNEDDKKDKDKKEDEVLSSCKQEENAMETEEIICKLKQENIALVDKIMTNERMLTAYWMELNRQKDEYEHKLNKKQDEIDNVLIENKHLNQFVMELEKICGSNFVIHSSNDNDKNKTQKSCTHLLKQVKVKFMDIMNEMKQNNKTLNTSSYIKGYGLLCLFFGG